MRILVVGLSLLWGCGNKADEPAASPVQAPPPEPSAKLGLEREAPLDAGRPDASPRPKEYIESLRRGRDLMHQGAYPAATKSFEEALDALPGDPRAFSELSWAAFHSGDMERALSFSTSAVAASNTPRLKAASLYTLGRIREEQGAIDKARLAYAESIALRPHQQVEIRLHSLSDDKEAGGKLLGPFANLGEFCQQYASTSVLARRTSGDVTCDPRPRISLARSATSDAASPFQSAQLFEIRAEAGGRSVALQLAIKVENQWFVMLDAIDLDQQKGGLDNASLSIEPGTARGLLLRYDLPDMLLGHEVIEAMIRCQASPETRPVCARSDS